MSYTSDVRIRMKNKDFKIFDEYINDYLKQRNKGLGNNLLNMLDINRCTNEQRYFGWNNIKWYTHLNNDKIDALTYGLDKLKKEQIPFRFLRIGEENNDIEEIINDDYLLVDYIDLDRRFIE